MRSPKNLVSIPITGENQVPSTSAATVSSRSILNKAPRGKNLEKAFEMKVLGDSDSDASGSDFDDDAEANPYFRIVSNVPPNRPANWCSYVLFNGRVDADQIPINCPKPQMDNGSLVPEVRKIVENLVDSRGFLRKQKTPLISLKLPVTFFWDIQFSNF
jgi:hypothetical protein